jgi:diaminopropionate ammonia-lyase
VTDPTPQVHVHPNPRVERTQPYEAAGLGLLDAASYERARAEISTWSGYAPTMLRTPAILARAAGVAQVAVKDEGGRFGLGSFKAIGGAYAVYRLLADIVAGVTGERPNAAELASGEHARFVRHVTVTCASEGNHGRAVAWGAERFGCRAVIYARRAVSGLRLAAIARHGAEIELVDGTYDDAVLAAQTDATRHGRLIVSDTAYPGCEQTPTYVMEGYTVIAAELLEQAAHLTHVFVQAGVGGLAAAVAAHLWRVLGADRPRFVVVEPEDAACLLASARARAPVRLQGALGTAMTCLACGTPSTLAFDILSSAADAFVAVPDAAAEEGVRRLGSGRSRIATTPSGAAGVGALLAAAASPEARERLGLTADSRVACIVTEAAVA